MPHETIEQSATPREELRAFVTAAHEHFAGYHAHKEAMAYSGTALYVAAAASALTGPWPPSSWTWRPTVVAVLAFSGFWVAMLYYLRFQLQRRRWAALRIAGCDRLLASWLPGAPPQDDRAHVRREGRGLSKLGRFIDWFWPLQKSVPAVDASIRVYPPEIEAAWLAAADRGTEAIRHERLIHVVGWVLYLAVIGRTVLAT